MQNAFSLKMITVPTIVIEGDEQQLVDSVVRLLCDFFCEQQAIDAYDTCNCRSCRKIKQTQHPYVEWIRPSGNTYSVDDIAIIFERARFALEQDERFVFVIHDAQLLNQATANRLLKMLEEPPLGYFFILLTTNKSVLLPTIISRSHVIVLNGARALGWGEHPLFRLFSDFSKFQDPLALDALLKSHKLTEAEIVDMCYELVSFYSKNAGTEQAASVWYAKALSTTTQALRTPPGAGSGTLFLKRLFLALCTI